MEVDPPPVSVTVVTPPSGGTLKRSNSAPMINALCSPTSSASPIPSPCPSVSSEHGSVATSGLAAHSQLSQSTTNLYSSMNSGGSKPMDISRIRRYSASCTSGLHSPTGIRGASRLDQIKLEESTQKDLREVAHERERLSEMQMSTSWEGLTLDERMMVDNQRPKSLGEPLLILTSPCPYSSSPSPTRVGKQCFSPSLQQPIKNNTLTPSPSPSPTRKTFARRSLSPIAVRPSPLSGLKRKVDLDELDRMDTCSPAKRFNSGWITPEKLHLSRPLLINPMTDSHSPEQQVPMSISTTVVTGTTQTLQSSSSGLPCFFRPVRDSIDSEDAGDVSMTEGRRRSSGGESSSSVNFHTPMKESPEHV